MLNVVAAVRLFQPIEGDGSQSRTMGWRSPRIVGLTSLGGPVIATSAAEPESLQASLGAVAPQCSTRTARSTFP